MNTSLKFAMFASACAMCAGTAMADASMHQITTTAEGAMSAKMDSDAKGHLFQIAVGNFGVVDTALGSNDADYEIVLADRGIAVGAALYGQNDAAYDAFLTPANFFETAALGQHDASYEVILSDRGIPVGAKVYGQYDADYEASLFPQTDGCQTGQACF